VLRLSVVETVWLFLAALLLGALVLRWLVQWWHARAVTRARRIVARLRTPATTLAAVEDQASAVEELCQLSDIPAAVEAARELLTVMDATVRSAAIEILRRSRALDLWARDLEKGGYRAKLRAIEALAEVGDERAIDTLVQALGDDDPDVARAASQAMVGRDPDYASERLAEALVSTNRRIAETAAATLVRMGDDAAEALVSELSSLSAQARRLAAESLGAIGNASFASALMPMLSSDPSPGVRGAVAEALCRLGCDKANDHLRRVAESDPDWFVRARTVFLMAEMGAPGAKEFLLSVLARAQADLAHWTNGSEDVEAVTEGLPRVRSAALAGLRLLGLTDAEIAAVSRLPVQPIPSAAEPTSGASYEELPALGGQADDPLPSRTDQPDDGWISLAVSLRDRDPGQRAEAARQLAEAGPPALRYLQTALNDPEPMVRGEAARALGRIGDSGCLSALATCLQDPDPDVRLAVSNAMRGIVMRGAARHLPSGESRGGESELGPA